MKKFKRIYIEITNICNLNCSFCPKNKRPKKFMSIDEFKIIVSKISPLTDTVCLHLMGEPLLHPNLKEIFSICKQHNLKIFLTTNGTLIKENVNLLKEDFCKRISISLHSYEANKNQITLEEYLNNIFNSCKEISKNNYTYIEFRLWNENENVLAKNTLNNKIIEEINKFFNSNIKISENTKKYFINENIYLALDNVFEWPINTLNTTKNCKKFCYGLRTHFAILCDGTVVACCLDSEGKLNLGNIFEKDINEILNCEKAKNIYNGFTNKNITEEFCKTCVYANKFK